MNKINTKNPVRIIHWYNGVVAEFISYRELLVYLKAHFTYSYSWSKKGCLYDLGTHFTQRCGSGDFAWDIRNDTYNDYIVRDSYNRVFTKPQLEKDITTVEVKKTYACDYDWYGYVAHHCKFRIDPVPGRGRWNKARGHYYRHPGTTSEKRNWDKVMYDVDESEHRIHFRSSRTGPRLPSLYDDKPVHRQKNWKKFRKDQYKVPKEISGL